MAEKSTPPPFRFRMQREIRYLLAGWFMVLLLFNGRARAAGSTAAGRHKKAQAPAMAPAPSPLLPAKPIPPQPSNAPSPKPSVEAKAPALAPSPSPLASRPPPIAALSNGSLDPAQLAALKSLNLPIQNKDHICAPAPDSPIVCDQAYPTQHIVSLQLNYCPEDSSLSKEALEALAGSLKSLSFLHCPMAAIPFPSEMTSSLEQLSIVSSLGRDTISDTDMGTPAITGVWLSRFHRLSKLEVRDIVVNASGLAIILSNMTNLKEFVISNTTLSGKLLRSWPANLTTLDLSNNKIQGNLPSFFGQLQHLESMDLTGNNITGHIPESVSHLRSLRKLALGKNALWGPVPKSLVNLTTLAYLDLNGNQLNGTIPDSIADLPSITYVDLRNNAFNGILPLNTSTIQRFNSFKVGGNPSLCYNSSATSSKLVVGLAKCDDLGNPIVPSSSPASSGSGSSSSSSSSSSGSSDEDHRSSSASPSHKSGAKKVVWAIATTLGAIFLFIVILVALSRWCKSNKR